MKKWSENIKMIQFLKKGLNNVKEELSDNLYGYGCLFMFVMVIVVILSVEYAVEQSPEREYCDSGRVFATNKITVTDKYLARSSNEKGVQKSLTVKFNGESYYISDSKLYDKVKKGDRLKGYYGYDYIWGGYHKVLYSAEGKHVSEYDN